MLTGGGGSSKVSDCMYVTPIPFFLECLEEFGLPANIPPWPPMVFFKTPLTLQIPTPTLSLFINVLWFVIGRSEERRASHWR